MNTTLTLDDRRPALRNAGAYAAAAWGVLFSLVHVYWLAGGRAGLPNGQSIFDNTPLLIIDVVAIPVSAIAAALALALVRPWGERLPRRMLLAGTWGATALMIVHALPSTVDWAALAVGAKSSSELTAEERFATFLYEPWFMAGGVLFGLAALAFQLGRRQ